MKLTTEQIERILSEAPDDATHCDKEGKRFYKHQRPYWFQLPYWLRYFENGGWRNIGLSLDSFDLLSIDSLREILALRK
ncbi:MAG: hypothetical protein EBT51_12395 [Flavobacteriaceae bacterium]|nr:hypothetical protein [Flavobacteriaceae bacterium]